MDAWAKRAPCSSVPFELDSEFARAYADLAATYRSDSGVIVDSQRAEQYFKEALQRLDKVGERERFEIQALYYNVMNRREEAISMYRSLIERYPGVDEYHRALRAGGTAR